MRIGFLVVFFCFFLSCREIWATDVIDVKGKFDNLNGYCRRIIGMDINFEEMHNS